MDIPKDTSIAKIILPTGIATFILLIMGFFSPVFEILTYIAWYLGVTAIISQDRTTIEILADMIIIHRRFFGPVIINKKDITKIHSKQRSHHKYRGVWYLIMLIIAGYFIQDVFYGIQKYQMLQAPLEASIYLILAKFMSLYLILVLFFNLERRLEHPTLLAVETNNLHFGFYPDKPDELQKIFTNKAQESF
ncbi:hypothetical protein V7O66_10455 [Methanolobus sp. ZRKC3]|uniref:hypothetical protein n=1 Tax=Methanolobus sp. ZRKC3 TaxID=3125786 RepID=UPI00324729E7